MSSFIGATGASAATLIRDAEIEHTLRAMAEPIFKTAGLTPENVRIFIVQDPAINAYVAGGQNIFLHTGIIQACENPSMLLGVIAHETGHIAGGHLARGAEQLRDAQLGAILGYVLGAAAAVGGGGNAGIAVLSGSQGMVERAMMSYSRAQEQAADQAALGYLDKNGATAQGMVDLFAMLRRDELRKYGNIDPYAITHPLSRERIEHVRAHVEQSGLGAGKYPKGYDAALARMRAKLFSFLELPPRTFARYPASDKSVAARLARAVAYFRTPDLAKALAEIDPLIAEFPKDAYFRDLKGQILFENGHIEEAVEAYGNAARLAPSSPLILISLAEAEIATHEPARLGSAISHLEKAIRIDNSNSHAWRLLATAYGQRKDDGMTALALAEEGALNNAPGVVLAQAERAIRFLPQGTPARLRAEDLKHLAGQMKEDAKN